MAANIERGEVSLVVDGTRYVLTVSLSAMLELEDVSGGRTYFEVSEGMQDPKTRIRDLVWLAWAALREHHPEIAHDGPGAVKDIAKFIDRAGGLHIMTDAIARLIELHNKPAELQEAGGRPMPAAGEPSSASRGDASGSNTSAAA